MLNDWPKSIARFLMMRIDGPLQEFQPKVHGNRILILPDKQVITDFREVKTPVVICEKMEFIKEAFEVLVAERNWREGKDFVLLN